MNQTEKEMNKKPLIGILVDNHDWCWTKTAKDLMYQLPEFDYEVLSAYKFKKLKDYYKYDFLYLRGYANAFFDFSNQERIIPFISTLSTGGEALNLRMDQMRDQAKKGWGLIVQNKRAYHKAKLEHYERVFLIPNGVDTFAYSPATEKPKSIYVGMAGNMKDERAFLKGRPFVEEAVKGITDVQFVETPQENPLNYEGMMEWYQALTIYAQPSESEGCSNSVMEAMSSGLPCLICDGVGYHGEVCLDGRAHKRGSVLFVERNMQSIRKAIKYLLDNPDEYKRISTNAREFAKDHNWRFIAEKFRPVFQDLFEFAIKKKKDHSKVIDEFICQIKGPKDYAKLIKRILKLEGRDETVENALEIISILGGLK